MQNCHYYASGIRFGHRCPNLHEWMLNCRIAITMLRASASGIDAQTFTSGCSTAELPLLCFGHLLRASAPNDAQTSRRRCPNDTIAISMLRLGTSAPRCPKLNRRMPRAERKDAHNTVLLLVCCEHGVEYYFPRRVNKKMEKHTIDDR